MTAAPNKLTELRKQLSALDSQILNLFSQRISLIDSVAALKAVAKELPVYIPQREEQQLNEAGAALPPELKSYAQALTRTLLRLARERQYDLLLDKAVDWELGRFLDLAPDAGPPVRTVAFPGTNQSYAHQGATRLFPGAAFAPLCSPEAACRQVADGNVDAAVLPLENSTAGVVAGTYSLLEKHRLFILASAQLDIRHALMALPGTQLADIRKVISHPQALRQCSLLIEGMGWETQEAGNTAYAARIVDKQKDPSLAALASPEAAAATGLTILLPQASNTDCNQTRFIAVGREFTLPANAQRVSVLLKTVNEAGALAKVLNIFADLDLDLAKIQSTPLPKQPWHYSFYLDFYAAPPCRAARRALYQLEKEALSVRLLGWYPQDPV